MANKRRGAQRAGSGVIWGRGFMTGLASGIIAAAAVYFVVLSPAQQAVPVAIEMPKDDVKLSGPKPKFEFYTILPELEVPVPSQSADTARPTAMPPALQAPPGNTTPPAPAPLAEPTPPPLAAPAADGRYILQAGSSRNAVDAERLRASLALQGMVAQIQVVSINGETWHRIRVGPFNTRADAETVQRQLRNADITTMLLELRTP
ncbi:SPOR domain-containing protein [Immundisolibacter sp.]|uniref:SPOR domain-containing protein n=1 Tax=Immundisolibacter sp. TaxID=1934948 RepID=UPI003561AD46